MTPTEHSAHPDALLLPEHSATLHTRVGCPDDATILQFVTGELLAGELSHIDEHLDSCPDCRTVVVELAKSTPSTADDDGDSGDEIVRRGSQIGRYIVIDVVGSGAMGVVYAAYDPDLNRRVALKVLRADTDERWSADARERLVREAQAMARLSHPNVVAVYEVGSVGDSVFFAMELVNGVTLRRWLASGARSWRAIRDVFVQAGRGLAAAHEAGLVHRDFKPDNVIVDRRGHVRVTDFGLARGSDDSVDAIAGAAGAGADRLTHTMTLTGAMLGTPAYMAPEQLTGAGGDARSDQFAYCVSLYEALAGERPFAADDFESLVEAVVNGPDPRPPGDAPAWLQAVVARGLSREPDGRYASMSALLEDMHGDAGAAPRPGRWASLSAAVVIGGLIVGGYLWARSDHGAEVCAGGDRAVEAVWNDDRRAAITDAFVTADPAAAPTAAATIRALDAWRDEWVRMHGDTCRATRALGEQSEQLLDVRMQCLRRQLGELDALAAQLARADAHTIDAALSATSSLGSADACGDVETLAAVAPPPSDAATAEALDTMYLELAEAKAATATAWLTAAGERSAEALRMAQDTGYLPAIAEAKLVRADAMRASGQLDAALDMAYGALWAAEEAHSDRVAARAWLLVIAIAGDSGRYDVAAEAGGHARAAVARVGSPPLLVARLRNTLGVIYYNQGRHDEARAELTSALLLRTEHLGEQHIEVSRSHTNLGNVERATGHLAEALEHHRAAMAIDRELLGDRHLAAGRHLHNIAGVLKLDGARDEAREYYERALELERDLLGDDHHEVALTHNSLGLLFYESGDLVRAEHHYRKAIDIYDRAGHSDRAVSRHNLGLVLAARGDHAGALALFDEALPIYLDVYGDVHERVALLVLATGHARAAAGDTAGALAAYEVAVKVARALGSRPDILAEATQSIAELTPQAKGPAGSGTSTATEPPAAAPVPGRTVAVPPTIDTDVPPTAPPATQAPARPDPGKAGVYGAGQAWDTP